MLILHRDAQLLDACETGNINTVKMLVEGGVNINADIRSSKVTLLSKLSNAKTVSDHFASSVLEYFQLFF